MNKSAAIFPSPAAQSGRAPARFFRTLNPQLTNPQPPSLILAANEETPAPNDNIPGQNDVICARNDIGFPAEKRGFAKKTAVSTEITPGCPEKPKTGRKWVQIGTILCLSWRAGVSGSKPMSKPLTTIGPNRSYISRFWVDIQTCRITC